MATPSRIERVIVIDPGERVGWATATLRDGVPHSLEHGISLARGFALRLHEQRYNYDTFVFESYRIRQDTVQENIGSELLTPQVIGMIRLCAWVTGARLVSQSPSCKKTGLKWAEPDILRRIQAMPKAHDEAHDGDALMHLSYYIGRVYTNET